MLQVKNTTNNLGLTVSGSPTDFLEMLQAINAVAGPTGKRPCMAAAHVRVSAFCSQLHSALTNSGCSFNLLWPEAVFIVGSLSGFIKFESEDLSKKSFIYDVIASPKVIFDENIIKLRLLQAKIISALQAIISQQSFTRILNIYGSGHTYFVDYETGFLDLMNCEYISLSKEARLKKLAAVTINILNRSGKYLKFTQEAALNAGNRKNFAQTAASLLW